MVDALLRRRDPFVILIRRIQYIFVLLRADKHMPFEKNICQFLEIRLIKNRDKVRNAEAFCLCPVVFRAVFIKLFYKSVSIACFSPSGLPGLIFDECWISFTR